MAEHKIPRWLRKANFIYQIILIVLTGITILLSALTDAELPIPTTYFEYYSIIISALPVFWSKILDASKKYIDDLTPEPSIASPPNSPDSTTTTQTV